LAFYAAVVAATAGVASVGAPLWMVIAVAVVVAVLFEMLVPPPPPRVRLPDLAAKPVAADSRFEVRFDDEMVVVLYDGAPRERVTWSRLRLVGIRIDDAWLPQPWWLLADADGGCTFPSDARGWEEMLHAMGERLPGFDHGAVIRAMTLMSGGVVVWKAGDPSAPSPHLNLRGGDPR
jgi:hypothetical protein